MGDNFKVKFLKKAFCIIMSICTILQGSPCHAGKGKKGGQKPNFSVSSLQNSDTAKLTDMVQKLNGIATNALRAKIGKISETEFSRRKHETLKALGLPAVEKFDYEQFFEGYSDFVSDILIDPSDVNNHIAGVKLFCYATSVLNIPPNDEQSEQEWKLFCGLWFAIYKILNVTHKYIDADLKIPEYSEWPKYMLSNPLIPKLYDLERVIILDDFDRALRLNRQGVVSPRSVLVPCAMIISGISTNISKSRSIIDDKMVNAPPILRCLLTRDTIKMTRKFCVYPEYPSPRDFSKWINIDDSLEYPHVLELNEFICKLFNPDDFGDFLYDAMNIFIDTILKYENKLLKRGIPSAESRDEALTICRGFRVARIMLCKVFKVRNFKKWDLSPEDLLIFDTPSDTGADITSDSNSKKSERFFPCLEKMDEFFSYCRCGEFMPFPFNNFYGEMLKLLEKERSDDFRMAVVKYKFNKIRHEIDESRKAEESTSKSDGSVGTSEGDDSAKCCCSRDSSEDTCESRSSDIISDYSSDISEEGEIKSPEETTAQSVPDGISSSDTCEEKPKEDQSQKIEVVGETSIPDDDLRNPEEDKNGVPSGISALMIWKQQIRLKREEKQRAKAEQRKLKRGVCDASKIRRKVLFLCEKDVNPMQYIDDHMDMPYRKYFEDWLRYGVYSNDLIYHTKPLAEFPGVAPFYFSHPGAPKINRRGKLYKVRLGPLAETTGLRIVYYIDSETGNVVIIYLGAPFGAQHKNEIETLQIDSNWVFKDLPHEYDV